MHMQNSMFVILCVFYVNSWLKYLLLAVELSLQHSITANLTFNAWVRFRIILSCKSQIINLRYCPRLGSWIATSMAALVFVIYGKNIFGMKHIFKDSSNFSLKIRLKCLAKTGKVCLLCVWSVEGSILMPSWSYR